MDYRERLNKAKEEMTATRRKNLEALVHKYGSITALAIAVSRPATQIGDMVRGQKVIGDKIARHIEEELNLDFRSLDKGDAPKEEPNVIPVEPEPITPTLMKIPVLSSVQAGNPTDSGDIRNDEYVIWAEPLDGDVFALEVRGDSMNPRFHDGDLLIVRRDLRPRTKDFVIAQSDLDALSEATFKQYFAVGITEFGEERFELRPLNPEYFTLDSIEHKLRIVGVVIRALSTYRLR